MNTFEVEKGVEEFFPEERDPRALQAEMQEIYDSVEGRLESLLDDLRELEKKLQEQKRGLGPLRGSILVLEGMLEYEKKHSPDR